MSAETAGSLELDDIRQAMWNLQDKMDQQHLELIQAVLQTAESTSYSSSLPFKEKAQKLQDQIEEKNAIIEALAEALAKRASQDNWVAIADYFKTCNEAGTSPRASIVQELVASLPASSRQTRLGSPKGSVTIPALRVSLVRQCEVGSWDSEEMDLRPQEKTSQSSSSEVFIRPVPGPSTEDPELDGEDFSYVQRDEDTEDPSSMKAQFGSEIGSVENFYDYDLEKKPEATVEIVVEDVAPETDVEPDIDDDLTQTPRRWDYYKLVTPKGSEGSLKVLEPSFLKELADEEGEETEEKGDGSAANITNEGNTADTPTKNEIDTEKQVEKQNLGPESSKDIIPRKMSSGSGVIFETQVPRNLQEERRQSELLVSGSQEESRNNSLPRIVEESGVTHGQSSNGSEQSSPKERSISLILSQVEDREVNEELSPELSGENMNSEVAEMLPSVSVSRSSSKSRKTLRKESDVQPVPKSSTGPPHYSLVSSGMSISSSSIDSTRIWSARPQALGGKRTVSSDTVNDREAAIHQQQAYIISRIDELYAKFEQNTAISGQLEKMLKEVAVMMKTCSGNLLSKLDELEADIADKESRQVSNMVEDLKASLSMDARRSAQLFQVADRLTRSSKDSGKLQDGDEKKSDSSSESVPSESVDSNPSAASVGGDGQVSKLATLKDSLETHKNRQMEPSFSTYSSDDEDSADFEPIPLLPPTNYDTGEETKEKLPANKRMSVSDPGEGEWKWQTKISSEERDRLTAEEQGEKECVENIIDEILNKAVSDTEEREESEEKADVEDVVDEVVEEAVSDAEERGKTEEKMDVEDVVDEVVEEAFFDAEERGKTEEKVNVENLVDQVVNEAVSDAEESEKTEEKKGVEDLVDQVVNEAVSDGEEREKTEKVGVTEDLADEVITKAVSDSEEKVTKVVENDVDQVLKETPSDAGEKEKTQEKADVTKGIEDLADDVIIEAVAEAVEKVEDGVEDVLKEAVSGAEESGEKVDVAKELDNLADKVIIDLNEGKVSLIETDTVEVSKEALSDIKEDGEREDKVGVEEGVENVSDEVLSETNAEEKVDCKEIVVVTKDAENLGEVLNEGEETVNVMKDVQNYDEVLSEAVADAKEQDECEENTIMTNGVESLSDEVLNKSISGVEEESDKTKAVANVDEGLGESVTGVDERDETEPANMAERIKDLADQIVADISSVEKSPGTDKARKDTFDKICENLEILQTKMQATDNEVTTVKKDLQSLEDELARKLASKMKKEKLLAEKKPSVEKAVDTETDKKMSVEKSVGTDIDWESETLSPFSSFSEEIDPENIEAGSRTESSRHEVSVQTQEIPLETPALENIFEKAREIHECGVQTEGVAELVPKVPAKEICEVPLMSSGDLQEESPVIRLPFVGDATVEEKISKSPVKSGEKLEAPLPDEQILVGEEEQESEEPCPAMAEEERDEPRPECVPSISGPLVDEGSVDNMFKALQDLQDEMAASGIEIESVKKELEELEEDLKKSLKARSRRRSAVDGSRMAGSGPLLGRVTNLKTEIEQKISTVEMVGCLRPGAKKSSLTSSQIIEKMPTKLEVKQVGDDFIAISWPPPKHLPHDDAVIGYQVQLDGETQHRVRNPSRRWAVLEGVSGPRRISVVAETMRGQELIIGTSAAKPYDIRIDLRMPC